MVDKENRARMERAASTLGPTTTALPKSKEKVRAKSAKEIVVEETKKQTKTKKLYETIRAKNKLNEFLDNKTKESLSLKGSKKKIISNRS